MSADRYILPLAKVSPDALTLAGGKGCNLAALAANGFAVPATLVVTAPAYRDFIAANDLEERILLELNRKAFADMRWEEIWDAALRVRNLFLRASWPPALKDALQRALKPGLADGATVIRSSATSEDSAGASFAGLHESYVNVRGLEVILEHVRKVWASLWSDAALLYRQELGLAPARSDMAVLIQELVLGDASGVAFSVNALDADQSVFEAVPGLNQGLVDGMITPDRWILERRSGKVTAFTAGEGNEAVFPARQGVARRPVARRAGESCLADDDVQRLFDDVRQIETCFGCPQDVEWTLGRDRFTYLQTRPVTATANGGRDQRGWYLSLRRSYENLCRLRSKIEDDLIPRMIQVAHELALNDLDRLPDEALAAEIERRAGINHHWSNVYYADFIPFAHGVRLFGQVYNDALKPDDPYAFVDLLTDTPMESLARNRRLEALAAMVRDDSDLAARLRGGQGPPSSGPFRSALDEFLSDYGDLSSSVTGDRERTVNHGPLIHLVLELAAAPSAGRRISDDARRGEERFLDCFGGDERAWAAALLDLARASYRLRDDDNIHLSRIEAQLRRAVRVGHARLDDREAADGVLAEMVARHPLSSEGEPKAPSVESASAGKISARQLVGQPAGPGVARGPARVVHSPHDLARFRAGEVLICDAVDPNMTFVVPLAAGIVERRGGMLIHGAIIAREYGLACVTGVPEIMRYVASGDEVTVDGYLGIVIIGRQSEKIIQQRA